MVPQFDYFALEEFSLEPEKPEPYCGSIEQQWELKKEQLIRVDEEKERNMRLKELQKQEEKRRYTEAQLREELIREEAGKQKAKNKLEEIRKQKEAQLQEENRRLELKKREEAKKMEEIRIQKEAQIKEEEEKKLTIARKKEEERIRVLAMMQEEAKMPIELVDSRRNEIIKQKESILRQQKSGALNTYPQRSCSIQKLHEEVACYNAKIMKIRELLNNGAEINSLHEDTTALMIAVEAQNDRITEFLLK